MKLIKSIVRPNKVDDVRDALEKMGVPGMTVTEVRGHGRQKGHTAMYRGKEYNVSLLPKVEIEVVVSDEMADEVIQGNHQGGADGRNRRRARVRDARRPRLQHPHGGNRHDVGADRTHSRIGEAVVANARFSRLGGGTLWPQTPRRGWEPSCFSLHSWHLDVGCSSVGTSCSICCFVVGLVGSGLLFVKGKAVERTSSRP